MKANSVRLGLTRDEATFFTRPVRLVAQTLREPAGWRKTVSRKCDGCQNVYAACYTRLKITRVPNLDFDRLFLRRLNAG